VVIAISDLFGSIRSIDPLIVEPITTGVDILPDNTARLEMSPPTPNAGDAHSSSLVRIGFGGGLRAPAQGDGSLIHHCSE
jgi:hypothetical protein